MAVQQIERVYENRPYTFYNGVDENNEFVEYVEEGIKYTANNLTGRFFPVRKEIEHKRGNGNIAYIITHYEWAMFDDAGVEVPGTAQKYHPTLGGLTIKTNQSDQTDFTVFFGPQVARFDANGFARVILGQPKTNRVFNDNGSVVTQTEEMKAAAPTRLYAFNDIAPTADADTPNP